ncbi:MAG TPA: hypothetical protein DEP69_04405, partial [Acidimicrobiaceae bacterium]|nr:hypothetical protein [Acidimicrobiaceae bacterium]
MFSPPTVRDDVDGAPVLVKHASGDDRGALRREAGLLERAAHPGVVEVRGLLELEDRAELTLTYVESAPLAEHPPLALETLLDVVLQVSATLVDLHDVGVRHGAVSAEHVLIDRQGRAVLCGFGSAGAANDPQSPAVGNDVAAVAELLASELDRTEDAGLTTMHRRAVSELRSAIRFVEANRAPAGAGTGLRQWIEHLSEVAHAARVAADGPRRRDRGGPGRRGARSSRSGRLIAPRGAWGSADPAGQRTIPNGTFGRDDEPDPVVARARVDGSAYAAYAAERPGGNTTGHADDVRARMGLAGRGDGQFGSGRSSFGGRSRWWPPAGNAG